MSEIEACAYANKSGTILLSPATWRLIWRVGEVPSHAIGSGRQRAWRFLAAVAFSEARVGFPEAANCRFAPLIGAIASRRGSQANSVRIVRPKVVRDR
jgi:hypothetical protein